jgi:ribonuclease BN (tRNA processing enzyme)
LAEGGSVNGGHKAPIAALLSLAIAAFAGRATAAAPERAVWVTLGTGGGPVIRPRRSEPANALVLGKSIYLFDVGNGVLRQLAAAHLDLRDVRAIFISHQHIDHNADIGVVLIERWFYNDYRPIPVIGAPGTVSLVRHVIEGYHATELAPMTEGGPAKPPILSTVRAQDIPRRTPAPLLVYRDGNIRVFAITNAHYHFPPGSLDARFSRSYSFRIETAHRIIVYTGDTGPSQHVMRLAKGADLLVSEVIDLGHMMSILQTGRFPAAVLAAKIAHMREDHLTPVEVGKLAAGAGVKEVVLTHLVPGEGGQLSGYTAGISRYFKGPVHVASDLGRW